VKGKTLARRAGLSMMLVVVMSALPGLPWSAECHHRLKRIESRVAMKVSAWRGWKPRYVSLTGACGLAGAQIQAVDSPSGWATLSDRDGRFVLPGLLWYKGARYELVVSADGNRGQRTWIAAPPTPPAGDVVDVGRLQFDDAEVVDVTSLPGLGASSRELFDVRNRDYYRGLYAELTTGLRTDEEKVDAINTYVSTKLNYAETEWDLGSPRRVLENGSQYCGHLGSAMAAILAAGYHTRIVHLGDDAVPRNTHALVEVSYGGSWHLYDPTFGVRFEDATGRVLSYRELRLDPSPVASEKFAKYRKKYRWAKFDWMAGIYASGFHHYYDIGFRYGQYGHAFWVYANGAEEVKRGERIWLAAAGVRPGSKVTYRIRKPGSDGDELSFTTRGEADSNSVLKQESSPPLDLDPGTYEVFVDLEDGNVAHPADGAMAKVTNWRLGVPLEVR
jgi:hypothetical protein